ncbi:MAG: type II toxin-antitoxin system VapC family toxin [Pseudonocardiaceae bacterium]
MIVLDACVLIAHLDTVDAHHDRATRLLASLVGQPKVVSVLTLAEVLVSPTRAGRRRATQDILDRLRIEVHELPRDVGGQLAELRAHTGLRMPDCCVLLTAERALATLATFDDRLARVATDRGLTVAPGTS